MIARNTTGHGFRVVWVWAALLTLLAIAVKGRWLSAADQGIAQGMAAIRTPGFDEVARALTFFGSSPWVLGVMVVMSLCWRRRRALLAVFWGTWLLGFAMQILLRLWVAQWRPDTVVVPVAADLMTRFDLAGFTSGHAYRSAFLYGWWAGSLTRPQVPWAIWGRLGCLVLIALVGLGRVYLNRHWFSDVLGAWLLALLVLSLATWLRHRLHD